jgi:cytochrome c-type biogenesis protein CcmF
LFSEVLLAYRVDTLAADGALGDPVSREGVYLLKNLLFVLFTFTVLVGTVFPLVVEAARGVQMSVGRPYFDAMAVPIGAALLFLMGVGPALPWGAATGEQVRRALLPPLIGAVILAAIGFALGVRGPWTLVTLAFGGYAAQVTLGEMWLPLRQRMRGKGEAFGQAFVEGQLRRGRRRFAAYVVHAGAAVVIIAIAVSSTMGISKEAQLRVGETTRVGDYTLTFLSADDVQEPHRRSLVATVGVSRGGKDLGTLRPAMNQYERQREPIGTPAVRTSLKEDLYLSVMNIDTQAGTLGLLAMVNPMVGCLWLATGVMALGGLMALVPSRRRTAVALPAGVRADLTAEPTR